MLIHIKNDRLKLIPDLVIMIDNLKEIFSFFNEETNFHINDSYHKILFYIAKYHYLKLTKKPLEQTKKQYSEMVQKTGFVLFDEDYLKMKFYLLINYFDNKMLKHRYSYSSMASFLKRFINNHNSFIIQR